MRRVGFFLGVAVCLLAVILCSGQSEADPRPTLAGVWAAAPLSERWNIGDWGTACGPKPQARELPGGQVVVTEEGAELVMTGVGRTFRTNECWEQLPNVSRGSHSISDRAWRTRCVSAPNDARQTTLVTNITATDRTMTLDETGEYQFRIEGQNCTASARRWRTFTIVQRQGEPAPSASLATAGSVAVPAPSASAAASARPSRCSELGEPTRIEVRPTRKLLRPGDRFSFRLVALDANGCPVEAHTTWTIATPSAKATVVGPGTIVIGEDARDGPIDIDVGFGGKVLHVGVEVATPARYDALLSNAAANDAGETEDAPATIVANGSLGARPAVAEDNAKTRRTTFIVIIGTLAVGLAGLGFVLLRRTTRTREPLEEGAPVAVPLAASSQPFATLTLMVQAVTCPSCRQEFPPQSMFCPHDGNRLVPAATLFPSTSAGGVCPTCGRGYDPGIKTCPVHGDDLVPAAVYQARMPQPAAAERGKICPSCGGRYGGEAVFCGKDGTALVLVN